MPRILVAFMGLALIAVGNAPDAAKTDLAKFQGQWTIAALEVNGGDVALDKLSEAILTVKDTSFSVKLGDIILPFQIALDPAKDPKEIDMVYADGPNKDKTQKGIYKISGDTFQISRGLDPQQNRPRDFASWPNSNMLVVTWKKK